jgi:hypothetical protein
MRKEVKLCDLVGEHVLSGLETGTRDVYGETCNCVKFTLDGVTYVAVEDPDDGYRSYMNGLYIVEEKCKVALPDIEVFCRMRDNGSDDVLVFHDCLNGNEILAIGTEDYSDYYPICIFDYHPENMSCNER